MISIRNALRLAAEVRPRLTAAVLICLLAGCDRGNQPSIDAVVTGDSMAPAFWGEHVRVTCEACEYSFRVGGQLRDLPDQLVCPNCGWRSIDASQATAGVPEKVRVKPIGDLASGPRIKRWDTVAIRATDDRPAMIKRVVGLPGESIQFANGDVFADGVIVRKSLKVARQVRVPVFDSEFHSTEVLRRFQPQNDGLGWELGGQVWHYFPSKADSSSDGVQWLGYQQWRCVATSLPRDQAVPVEDWYGGNVGLNRNLHQVDDVWVHLELRLQRESKFDLRIFQGSAAHEFRFDLERNCVSMSERSHALANTATLDGGSAASEWVPLSVEVCTFDQRLTLLVDGQQVVAFDLDPADGSPAPGGIVQIGGRSGALKMDRFRLWRDLYYFDVVPRRSGGEASSQLSAAADEYLLLGDNVPISIDSRHWSRPAVSHAKIIGSVSSAAPQADPE